ncbi:MAG TPA: DUF6600 domain-containing protein, partial [Rudaea sp.]
EPNGTTTIVTARQGGGDAYGQDGARFRVEEGQSITFNDPQLRDYVSNNLPRPDDFDNFCLNRDGRFDRSPSRQYVSEDVIGYADLDDAGGWEDEPEYGHVWYPTTVAAGWAPYHYGHWGWVGAYGWTWVDDAPWGFAPFHYGRWANVRGRWGWCPGPVAVRPYYAPALVAFVGGGGGVAFSVGGPVGWFPLGPRDVWVPGYRVSERYFVNVNVYNSRIDHAAVVGYYGGYRSGHFDYERVHYANRGVAGAIVAVPGSAFVSARPVAASAIAINRETFANARVSGFAAVAPTRASLVAANARHGVAPPPAVINRNIVAATRPPPPVASFSQREALLQRNPGQALNVHQLRAAPNATAQAGRAAGVQAVGRPNVNVVTSNGVPQRGARTVNNNALPAVQRGTPPNGAVNANAATLNRNGIQNGRAVGNNAVQPGERPAATQHLDSARFAHPNGPAGPVNGNAAIQNQGRNNGAGVNERQIQRGNAVNGVQNPNAGQNDVRGNPAMRTTGPASNAVQNNNAVRATNPALHTNVQSPNNPGGQTPAREYHAPVNRVQEQAPNNNAVREYHAPVNRVQDQAPNNNAARVYTPPQGQAHVQEYHAPVNRGPANNQVVTPAAREYHAPVNTPPVQHEQIQRAAPVQHTAPPPPQPHERSAPPARGKDKDDDKKHGGR